jgi:probable HAF family extracellular repeat protein
MRMSKLTFAALLLIACVPLALAQGTYTQIDVPGALGTSCLGVDAAGDIVGAYSRNNQSTYGFLLSNGAFTSIHYPHAEFTSLTGINDQGQIAGSSVVPDVGFLYEIAAGTFTEVRYPGAYSTVPVAINDNGVISGGATNLSGQAIGFELIGSTYRKIAPPGMPTVGLTGVTASGTLVGNVYGSSGTIVSNFEFSHGRYKPIAIPNAPNAVVTGVNPAGTALVGYYIPSPSVVFGFVYQDKAVTTLQFPGGNNTFAYGINLAGEVVGTFVDASGNGHGFTWTPPADAEKK